MMFIVFDCSRNKTRIPHLFFECSHQRKGSIVFIRMIASAKFLFLTTNGD